MPVWATMAGDCQGSFIARGGGFPRSSAGVSLMGLAFMLLEFAALVTRSDECSSRMPYSRKRGTGRSATSLVTHVTPASARWHVGSPVSSTAISSVASAGLDCWHQHCWRMAWMVCSAITLRQENAANRTVGRRENCRRWVRQNHARRRDRHWPVRVHRRRGWRQTYVPARVCHYR